MKKSLLFLFILYWLVLFTDCFLIINHYNEYRFYTKTLLVPLLLIAVYFSVENTKHKRSGILINIAFFFCFVGDVVTLNDTDAISFVSGLCSFLLAHILFIIFFYRLKRFTAKHRLFIFSAGISILAYISILLFLIRVKVSNQNFGIPVTIYSIVLGIMLLCAINIINNRSLKRLASNYFIPGAVLFVLSDSILAYTKFGSSFLYDGVIVMVTYAAALFFLATGAIRFLKK